MNNATQDMAISIEGMLEALSQIEALTSPEVLYRRDPAKERLNDLKMGRGVVSLNPELEELCMFHGYIVKKDGIEYRVLVDEVLRGARRTLPDGSTEVAAGYWIAPMSAPWPVIQRKESDET